MRVLVLLDSYIPFPKANGICINNMLRTLHKDDEISIICRSDIKSSTECLIEENNWNIYSIYKKKEKKYSQRNILGKIIYIINHIIKVFIPRIYSTKLTNLYEKKTKEVIKNNIPNIIISVLQPIAAVEAANRIKAKYPNIKHVIYNLDTPYSSEKGKIERLFNKICDKKILAWEKCVFKNANLIINLVSNKELYNVDKYAQYRNKMIYQEIPLLTKKETLNNYKKSEKIKMLYAGAFYEGLREPDEMLEIISNMTNINYELSIYTTSSYIKKIIRKNYKNIQCYELVDEKEISRIMQQNDFMISLGNKKSKMFPSKIISYLSSLKPIIHFYQDDMDPVIEFLKNNKHALLVNLNDSKAENKMKIESFMKKKSTIEWEYIYRMYYKSTPEYNMSMILERLK